MPNIKVATASPCAAMDASPSKYGSLRPRQAATRPSRQSPQSTSTTKAHDLESVELHDVKRMTSVTVTRRSESCFELGTAERRHRTIRIGKDSEELRQLSQANVTLPKQIASSSAKTDASSSRKAQRFRKIWTQNEVQCAPTAC
ncbi:hypothetical protein Gpo141_00009300 [Globisporangium polare]